MVGITQGAAAPAGAPRTVAEALGQIVWVLSQSPLHRQLPISSLEWTFMPAILVEQFRIFRFGPLPGIADPAALAPTGLTKEGLEQTPLGVAIWARLSAEAEARMEKGEHLKPADWRSGDRVWLLELISPFATPENKLSEAMLLDLMQGPFKQTRFFLHRTDPKSGQKAKVVVGSHLQT